MSLTKILVIAAALMFGAFGLLGMMDPARTLEMIHMQAKDITAINEVYSPTPEQVAYYKGMIAALEKAQAGGRAAVIYEGEHIDIAHVKTARDIIALAEQFNS